MLLGHRKQWCFLKNSFELDKIPNGLLFVGPEKIGKKTLALELAKYISCQATENKKPCNICQSCQSIETNSHPDVFLIEPEEKEIQIAQIRDLTWKLSLRPSFAFLKIAIIDRAHSMNSESQSALLKTLEEPKGKTLIILITEYPELLFQTIVSRCQKIKFYPFENRQIKQLLQGKGLSERKIEEISLLSRGKPGKAIGFLSKPEILENQQAKLRELIKISSSDLCARFGLAKKISETPEDVRNTLEVWQNYYRDILFSKINNPKSPDTPDYSFAKLIKILELIQTTDSLIARTNVNLRLALEVLMMEI